MCIKVCTVSDMAGRRHTTSDVMPLRRRSVRTERPTIQTRGDASLRIVGRAAPSRATLCQGPFTTFFDDEAGLFYLSLSSSRRQKKS